MPRRPLNRVDPRLPPRANVTYQLHAPVRTHWRKATCEEFGCLAHHNGWRVRLEGLPPEQVHAARTSGRRFTELRVAEGETYLVFEAGQPCFRASGHRVRVGRPEIYVVRGGDYRRYLGDHRRFEGRDAPAHWVEHFAENQDRVAAVVARG